MTYATVFQGDYADAIRVSQRLWIALIPNDIVSARTWPAQHKVVVNARSLERAQVALA